MERLREFFTFRFSDFITTLTHVLMDKFCPCIMCLWVLLTSLSAIRLYCDERKACSIPIEMSRIKLQFKQIYDIKII